MLNKLKKIEIEVDVEYKKYKQAWKAVSHKLEEIYSKIKQSNLKIQAEDCHFFPDGSLQVNITLERIETVVETEIANLEQFLNYYNASLNCYQPQPWTITFQSIPQEVNFGYFVKKLFNYENIPVKVTKKQA